MTPSPESGADRPSALRRALLSLLFVAPFALAAPTLQQDNPPGSAPASPLLAPIGPSGSPSEAGRFDGATGDLAMDALAHGRWAAACGAATAVLARQVPDLTAVGVFALCSAVANDRSAVRAAVGRLRGAESPAYFQPLAEGVLLLHDKAPDKALASFRDALNTRAGDPLAHYFEGEALHAGNKPAAAQSAFRATLATWPQFAPALTASARVLSGPKASQADLRAAVSLVEQATKIEPTNRGYWKLLADLCRRTGDEGRANAIELQYLRPRLPPAPR